MRTFAVLLIGMVTAFGPLAHAEQGDWQVRVGVSQVAPKSDNGDIVDVQDGVATTFNVTYFWRDNWAVELLAAQPFNHDIELVDGPRVAKTRHLPPTLSIQYHFMPDQAVRPYVGVGLNYTMFLDEETTGALDGNRLTLEDSFGVAAQVGVDIDLTPRFFLNVDARWIDIDTRAELNSVRLETVEIDPLVYGVSFGFRL